MTYCHSLVTFLEVDEVAEKIVIEMFFSKFGRGTRGAFDLTDASGIASWIEDFKQKLEALEAA